MFSPDDTIVAVATPPGRGGIGVIRISGCEAHRLAAAVLERNAPLAPRRATLTRVRSRAQTGRRDAADLPPPRTGAIDRVVATYFPGPNSYTGEDVVELSAHGSPVLLREILSLVIDAGARLAEPGEFTLRAYLNGQLDLIQAEAVADLIEAVTPLQARAAFDQLEGTLTARIAEFDRQLVDLITRMEASLDFPEEGYHFVHPTQVVRGLADVMSGVERLLADAPRGRALREGRQVVILGRPNVGKSSLFNALLQVDRAIVTRIPGTTRDLLTEVTELEGVAVTLVDTAGIRATADVVEMEGVRRAQGSLAVADLVLIVLDCSEALTPEDEALIEETRGRPRVIVANKADLVAAWFELSADLGPVVRVSATEGRGLGELRDAIVRGLSQGFEMRDVASVTNVRHIKLLEQARDALERAARSAAAASSEEFVLADLHEARHRLEEITGRRAAEDLLHEIFRRFCIGK